MTDLRDQLGAFEDAARRLLARRRLVLVHAMPAACHPGRQHYGRGLCRGCYDHHRGAGTLHDHPRRSMPIADFIADYRLLRSEGYTRRQIADRLGMRYDTLHRAYCRAMRAGDLEPDRRSA